MEDLKATRERINEVDKKMAALFEERMNLVGSVAEYKMKRGLPVFDGKREAEVIKRNENFVSNEEIRSYYVNFLKNTMEVSKRYQHRILEGMKVSYSGVTGAFAQIAVDKIFPDAIPVSCKDFKEAYEKTEKGETDCCVLPLENSNAGEVGAVIDLIFSGSLFVEQCLTGVKQVCEVRLCGVCFCIQVPVGEQVYLRLVPVGVEPVQAFGIRRCACGGLGQPFREAQRATLPDVQLIGRQPVCAAEPARTAAADRLCRHHCHHQIVHWLSSESSVPVAVLYQFPPSRSSIYRLPA